MSDKILSKDQVELKPGDRIWVPCEVVKCEQINAACNLQCKSCEKGTNFVLCSSEVMAKLPTPKGFSLSEEVVTNFATHALDVLTKSGSTAVDLIRVGFEGYKAFTTRDLTALFAALNDGKKDVNAIAAAIKAAFFPPK